MSNLDGMRDVMRMLSLVDGFVRDGNAGHLHDINTTLMRWSHLPQLERLGEVVVKAMLEVHSSDERVRRIAVAHLARVGRLVEAGRVERSEALAGVDVWTDEQERRRAEDAADFVLELERAAERGKA